MAYEHQRRELPKEELNFLKSMFDLEPFSLRHSPVGKDAYNCDPCDGCGADACAADNPLYERK
jgi:hypothetical protein